MHRNLTYLLAILFLSTGFLPANNLRAEMILLNQIPLNDPDSGYEPWGVAASPSDHRIYVACIHGANALMVIDALSDSVIAGVPITGLFPHGIEAAPAGDKVYIANYGGSVSIVDTELLEEIHHIPLDGSPMDLCVYSPVAAQSKLYVVDKANARVWVLDAEDGSLLTTISVGNYPWDICVIESTHRVYVANLSDHTVSVINAMTDAVIATIPVGSYPEGIAADPDLNLIYTADRDDNAISVINGATNTVIATQPVGEKPRHLAVDLLTHTIYVANSESYDVSILPSMGSVEGTVSVGLCPYGGIAVDPVLGRVFVTNIDSDDMTVFNTSEPREKATIRFQVHPGSVTLGLPLNDNLSNDHTVLVADHFGNEILHVDPASGSLIRVLEPGYAPSDIATRLTDGITVAAVKQQDELILMDWATGLPLDAIAVGDEPFGVAIREDINRVYVTNNVSCDMSVYDADSGRVIDTVPFDEGYVANDVAINETTNRIYVTTWWAWLWVLDGTTHHVIDCVTLHGFCEINQIAVNEMRNLIYVVALNCDVVWVVDGATHDIVAAINLPGYPSAITVNEKLQRAYVTAGSWLVAIGPNHTIEDQILLPAPVNGCAADPWQRKIFVGGNDAEEGGVLFEVWDPDPSDVPAPGIDTGRISSPSIRIIFSSAQPARIGSSGGAMRFLLDANGLDLVEVGIYDLSGRLVQHFDDCASGTHPFVWDGRDIRGNSVASGVYYLAARGLAPVSVHNIQDSKKVLLLK
ncbi:MAG: hypothetical protein KJ970_15690 [Candidatus Eisenbacteria bacterium]|uniref:FlgD Ig-like domain-containing protein n=1 Tax=Eiseniibacteriota bacterium TaxID=2212470 RepID=A0A948W7L3_UNCEI|nr:hypothetical protein [Candidatus Eisenbacteria bacterium]MBU1948090.1 hypothetical protein [Candidatus Eisenbacteria bacterium]MBU2692365.1 hypothetical protein [Candidatus Eisenbacteria bacterium]